MAGVDQNGHPLLPHHVPGGPGGGKPKKPKKPPATGGGSHSPYRPGTGQHPPGHPPKSGGGAPSGGGSHSPYRPGTGQHPPKPPAWVVRRQQVLRRAGYNVSVDGVWGPASAAAWAAFTRRIGTATFAEAHGAPVPAIPPGMTYYHGVLMTKQQARAAAAVEKGQANAAAILHKFKAQQLAHEAQKLADRTNPPAIGSPDAAGQRIHNAAQGAKQRAQDAADRAARKALNAQADERIRALAGIDGFKDPHVWEKRAAQGALGMHDLDLLIRRGWIDPTTHKGVRAIQLTLNSSDPKHKVKVDGVWGAQTGEAFRRAIARQAAKDWHDAVTATKQQLYVTHIAQRVVPTIIGHGLTPEQLTALLQRGGPDADRLARRLGRAYEGYREDEALKKLRTARADQLVAPLPNLPIFKSFQNQHDRWALLASGNPHDLNLVQATSLGDYIRRELALAERIRREQRQAAHQGGGGFWGTVTSHLAPVMHVIDYPRSKVEPVVFALDAEFKSITGGGFSGLGYQARAATLGEQTQTRGILSWHEAWKQGQVNYRELPGWQGLVADIALDPLTYVGPGILKAVGKGALTVGARTSLRTIDLIDHAEPIIGATSSNFLRLSAYRAAEDALRVADSHPFDATKSLFGWSVANRYPALAYTYLKLTSTRAAAAARITDHVRETFAATLRSITTSRFSDATAEHAAAMQKKVSEVARLLDPEMMDAIQQTTSAHLDALRIAAPDLMASLDQLPTSLYAFIDRRGGTLSIAGRRFEARVLNAARVSILTRYSMLRELADTLPAGFELRDLESLPLDQLANVFRATNGDEAFTKLLHDSRSMTHGAIPYEWRDAYQQELRVVTERLHKQLLPALDDQLRLRLSDAIWHTDGALLNEGSDAVRAALDRFFGHSIDDYYRRTVTVANPNFDRPVTEAVKNQLIGDEVRARESSVQSYAEMQTRIDGPAKIDHWRSWAAGEVKRVTADVEAAWVKVGRLWKDTRETLEVPAAVAEQLDGTAAHADLGQLASITADANRISQAVGPNPAAAKLARDAVEARVSQAADRWHVYADQTARLEAIHAMIEDRIVSKAYLDEWLVMGYLRHRQGWHFRVAYYALAGSMALWKTAVLPFRPAFFFRNFVDNWIKTFISGLHDPRLFFNAKGESLLNIGSVRAMLGLVGWFDRLHGTAARPALEQLLNHFWTLHPDTIGKIIGAHGIQAPAEILDATRTIKGTFEALDDVRYAPSASAISGATVREATRESYLPLAVRDAAHRFGFKSGADLVNRFTEVAWHEMAVRPEAYAKRALYTSEYRKGIADGLTETEATARAVKLVDKTLFDYDKITVAEENLKLFFPFIFFWRKNLSFWGHTAFEKPWIFLTADKLYNAHDESNGDQPAWMRRYVNLGFLADPVENAGNIAGVDTGWIANYLRGSGGDPLNYISIVQAYRVFKEGNPTLPTDKVGSWGFVSSVLDSLSTIGLGANPFLMSAGGRLGLLNLRAWQDIFPQTTMLQALTDTDWFRSMVDVGPNGFNLEDWTLDPLFKLMGQPGRGEMNRARFDQLVNEEMAFQAARGEPVNAAAAEEKVRGFFVFQTVMGVGLGLFPRALSPEVRGLYALIDQRAAIENDTALTNAERRQKLAEWWQGLTPEQEQAFRLWGQRTNSSPRQLQNYSDALLASRAYAHLDDYEERQQYLADHPEIAPIVNPIIGGRGASETFYRDLLLSADTDAVLTFTSHYLKGIQAAPDVLQAAQKALITPSLRKFWARNDTTSDQRERHIAGQFFHYIDRLNQTYYAIPEKDFEARQAFLQQHPELGDWWARNNTATDDFTSVFQEVNSTYRTIYFHFLDNGDWNSADEFLRRHPHIFDYTSADGRITADGHWLPKSQQQADYAKVSPLLDAYYALPKRERAGYLQGHPLLQAFFTKYASKGTSIRDFNATTFLAGGLSQHAKDYLAVKAALDAYFKLPDSQRAAFLAQHPELKAYFAKYSHERTMSQHARDYEAVKGLLDHYFSLPESERSSYLSRHPELKAYFDKYGSGKNGHSGSSFEGALREGLAENPDIAARYRFWSQFFALPPDQRAEFIHKHAAKAGIFIYGSLSYDQRQRDEANWHRQAVRLGQTDHQFWYLKVAPLLDIYFKLPKGSADRALFLQMNPELADYFARYSTATQSLPPKTRSLVEAYFRLPPFSTQRADFVLAHPELAHYFNSKATPRELAMQRQIDAYFQLPYDKRPAYLARHPEVKHYFDQRAREHTLYSSVAAAFNDTDPRMKPFYAMYADIIPLDAMRLFWLRAEGKPLVTQAGTRRDRQPIPKTEDALTRRDRAGTDPKLA